LQVTDIYRDIQQVLTLSVDSFPAHHAVSKPRFKSHMITY